jgi:hypothetical protein
MTKKPSKRAPLQAKDTKRKEKRKTGRPTVMTEAVQLEVCARISAGETLTHVCIDPRMPARQTVTNYTVGSEPDNLLFATRYASARERLLDVWAEEIVTISDDGTTDYIMKTGRNGHEYMAVDQEHIQRSRLRVDSRKWLLSKLRPNEYGDKLVAEVQGGVTVTHDVSTLSEREKMRRFALFMVEDQRLPVLEGVAISKPLKVLDQADAATLQDNDEMKP